MADLVKTASSGVYKRGDRFVIVYRVNGKQVWETVGTSQRGAQREREDRLAEVRNGTWKPPRERNVSQREEPTLAEYVEAWLARQDPARTPDVSRRRLSPATFVTYRGDLRRHVLPVLGSLRLSEIRTDDIDGLIRTLEDQGKAPGGIRNAVTPLRRVLGEAQRKGLIALNPASRCDLPPAQDFVGKEIHPEHVEEIRWALALAAPPDPVRGGQDFVAVLMFDLALGTGLRLGELRALRWGDIDLERQLIRVERAYSAGEISRPKSEAGKRAVPIVDLTREALVALMDRAIDYGRFDEEAEVLLSAKGTSIHPSNFNRRVWKPALRAAGLEALGYRWHDLRHTCVSRLVALGADPALVQIIAGHSDPRITLKRYTHVREARVTEAAQRFGEAFSLVQR